MVTIEASGSSFGRLIEDDFGDDLTEGSSGRRARTAIVRAIRCIARTTSTRRVRSAFLRAVRLRWQDNLGVADDRDL
ncbi:MAG: hypothetical protein ACLTQI_03145 [Slackia sp.]